MNELTQDLVRELFDYQDGNLYWKVAKGAAKIGDRAGTVRKDGYRNVKIDGKLYFTHRIIFLWHHGYLPDFLDHIDRNRSNNNIDNLREATRQQNGANQGKTKSRNGKPTTSQFKGVSWYKPLKKWVAKIWVGSKTKHLGYYDSETDAALVSDKALIKRDGKFARTNKSMGLYDKFAKPNKF